MHELALAERVVEAVIERVRHQPVKRVRLRVGRLAAVVPAAMSFCFEVVARGTVMEGAALEIEAVEARGKCRACHEEFPMNDGIPLCPCGSVDVAVVSGEELVIQDVEVG